MSLRYLVVAQKNNYIPKITKGTVIYWLLTSATVLPTIALCLFCKSKEVVSIAAIWLCMAIVGVYVLTNSNKTKLVFTHRARINYFFAVSVNIEITVALATLCRGITAICLVCAALCLSPLYVAIATLTTYKHLENKNESYVATQTEKLMCHDIIKIGITGSFGKTSCKNILKQMLAKKYEVFATESNYNTPMGIALSVDKLKVTDQVFIAEMGARKRGDIKRLCEVVKPDIGIITGICMQHIETFGSLHEVYLEKSELGKCVSMCVYNGNNKYSNKMHRERKSRKIKACVGKPGDVFVDNVDLRCDGSQFDLHIGDNVGSVKTRLLGKHNLQNIAMCAAVADYMSVNFEDILDAIKKLQPVSHRLEYTFSNGIHILDDGYNSNEVGIKCALEVVDTFDGRKVVVSQGLVECGKEKKRLNMAVGKLLSEHTDVMIICGANRRLIKKGVPADYSGELFLYKNLTNAQKHFKHILKKGDLLWLQNDLPDIY